MGGDELCEVIVPRICEVGSPGRPRGEDLVHQPHHTNTKGDA